MPPVDPNAVDPAVIRSNNAEALERYDRQTRTAAAYTTVITGAGYAGLIAVWTGLRSTLDRTSVLATALLIGVSLLSFIALEIAKASVAAGAQKRFIDTSAAHFWELDYPARLAEDQVREYQATMAINRLWPVSFWVSAVSGVLAALWLMSAIIVSLAPDRWQVWWQSVRPHIIMERSTLSHALATASLILAAVSAWILFRFNIPTVNRSAGFTSLAATLSPEGLQQNKLYDRRALLGYVLGVTATLLGIAAIWTG